MNGVAVLWPRPLSIVCVNKELHFVMATCHSASVGPVAKKPKRLSKWQPEWTRYNMSESKKGPSYVHCNVCAVDFPVAGGGYHEVKRHMERRPKGTTRMLKVWQIN